MKYWKRNKQYTSALFLIQNVLLQYEGFDDSYYYTKACMKICKSQKMEIPDIIYEQVEKYYLSSKTICELMIDISLQRNVSARHQQLLDHQVIYLLSINSCTEKIWKYFYSRFLRRKVILQFQVDLQRFFSYNAFKIAKKIN